MGGNDTKHKVKMRKKHRSIKDIQTDIIYHDGYFVQLTEINKKMYDATLVLKFMT